MKYLKSIFAFTLPLFLLLMSLSAYLSINNLVNNYKQEIINDYSILVVSRVPLNKDDITKLADIEVKDIKSISRDDILTNIKKQLSKTSFKLLQQKLPFFYKIYLTQYPSYSELNLIQKQLKEFKTIKRVETFASNHNKIYALLNFSQQLVKIVFGLFLIFVILFLSKQISIWFYEHKERIEIVRYHGGSLTYSAKPIIQVSFISALLSIILTIATLFFIQKNITMFFSEEFLSIFSQHKIVVINYIFIAGLSLIVSTLSIVGVLIKYQTKK